MPCSVPHGCPLFSPAFPAPLLAASAEKAGLKKALNKCHLFSWQQRSDPTGTGASVSGEWQQRRDTAADTVSCAVTRAKLRPRHVLPWLISHWETSSAPASSHSEETWLLRAEYQRSRECKQSLPPRLTSQISFKKTPVCCNKAQTAKPVQWIKRTSQTNGMPLVCIASQRKPTTEQIHF